MKYDYILIRYGELFTKGGNRRQFIKILKRNISHSLKVFEGIRISDDHDHMYVELNGMDAEPICERLSSISGIQSFSPVLKIEKTVQAMKENALILMKGESGSTFKVKAKRADKLFELDSYGICNAVAATILQNTSFKVDVHNPDVTLVVEVRQDAIYLYSTVYPGAGGYPLGANGKVMMMLSGGIDSPVAAYYLLRRGLKIECVHFAAPPYTSAEVLNKLKDIMKELNSFQRSIKLHVVPFTELQLEIYKYVPEPYCITIMRRMMYRIAAGLAKREKCLAIATGESIGQVASQTLESMIAINDVTTYPVIRPLAVEDKLEIIKESVKIHTYDISIRPYEDCCTIFKPKNPTTKPSIKDCLFYESKFEWQPLVEKCIKDAYKIFMVDGEEKFHPENEE